MAEAPFAGRLPVFVGDDCTDEYGFAAVTRAGRMGGQGRAAAPRARSYRLPDVAAVRNWLAALGRRRRRADMRSDA